MQDNNGKNENKNKIALAVKDRKEQFIDNCINYSPRIGTGFHSIDLVLNGGFVNEFYIMAAETSTGKSAIMMTLAQNMAKNGVNVLYFSLEMSADELIARGISALSHEVHLSEPIKDEYSSAKILYWYYDNVKNKFAKTKYEEYSEYAEEYFRIYGDHLYIIEGGINSLCAREVSEIALKFKEEHKNEQMVVFVDYLQVLKCDDKEGGQTDRKTKIDRACGVLKSLASQEGKMPVFTVSSIPRSNYNSKVGTSAFKESGDTEYTGGILIGWNWHCVTDVDDETISFAEEQRCNNVGYRKMNFEILKNRNAERNRCVRLVYYPEFNYFIDKDGYNKSIHGEDNPFEHWDSKELTEKIEAAKEKKKQKAKSKDDKIEIPNFDIYSQYEKTDFIGKQFEEVKEILNKRGFFIIRPNTLPLTLEHQGEEGKVTKVEINGIEIKKDRFYSSKDEVYVYYYDEADHMS